MEAELLLPGRADEIAWRLWATTRGAVRLELTEPADQTDPSAAKRRFDGTVATMIRGLRPSEQIR